MGGSSAVANGGAIVEEASAVQPIAALRQGRGTRLSFMGGGGAASSSRKRESIHLSNSESTIHETSRKSSVGASGAGDAADSVSEHSRSHSRSKENVANSNNRRSSFFRQNSDKATPPMPQYTPNTETTIVGGTQNGHTNGSGNVNGRTKSTNNSSGSNNYTTGISRTATEPLPVTVSSKPKGNAASEWVAELSRKSSDFTSLDRKRSMSSSAGAVNVMSGGNGNGATNEVDGPGVVKMGSVRKRLSMLKLGKKSSKASGIMVAVDEE